jgi:hypothetical protein
MFFLTPNIHLVAAEGGAKSPWLCENTRNFEQLA